MSNLRDKNDRAVRAFISPTVKGIGAGIPIYISLDPETRDVTTGPGLVDVQTGMGTESPKGSGNYTFRVRVRAKIPAVTQPGQPANQNHSAIGALADAIFGALHQSDNNQDYAATARLITVAGNALTTDGTGNNDDMGDYSAISITHDTEGGDKTNAQGEGLNFIEVADFQMNIVGFGGYWN